MSYSTLYVFPEDGIAKAVARYQNSHGTGPFVWTTLCEKHLRPDQSRYMLDAWVILWDEVKAGNVKLEWWEYNTLLWTYDNVLIKGRDLPLIAKSLRQFQAVHGDPKRVCHLEAVAAEIEKLTDPVPLAIGMWITSLSDNPWAVYVEAEEDYVAYNLHTGTKHELVELRDAPA